MSSLINLVNGVRGVVVLCLSWPVLLLISSAVGIGVLNSLTLTDDKDISSRKGAVGWYATTLTLSIIALLVTIWAVFNDYRRGVSQGLENMAQVVQKTPILQPGALGNTVWPQGSVA